MARQFCTSCGFNMEAGCKFCENCGAVLQKHEGINLEPLSGTAPVPPAPVTRDMVVQQARLVVTSWVIPFNASLVFGSTLIAIFDFLSPRVALLPIAATVAVVGLLSALALRKFVALSLPEGSAFRRALAPEAKVHKSPALIATGLLSALMVSGAAWSSAASPSGGVIASKFDAVRNAQMQLGVLQGVQKELRVQTAVLEDIREGRTLNPRRELANQGILWTHESFRNAINTDDPAVVSLFLAGGMKWNQYDAWLALRHGSEKMGTQLLQHTELFQRDDFNGGGSRSISDCSLIMGEFDKASKETKALPTPQQRPYTLTSMDKKFLKFFCSSNEDLKMAQLVLREKKSQYEALQASYKNQLETTIPASQCRQQLLGDGGRKLFEEGLKFNFPLYRGATDRDMMLNVLSDQIRDGGGYALTSKVTAAVEKYCVALANRKPEINFSDRSVQTALQIISALN